MRRSGCIRTARRWMKWNGPPAGIASMRTSCRCPVIFGAPQLGEELGLQVGRGDLSFVADVAAQPLCD